MNPIAANKSYTLVLIVCLLTLISIVTCYDFAYGGYDNWKHYLISHHLFRHPELASDTWGKPLFSILCSPFALWGYKGAQIFNVICFLLFTLTARKIFNLFQIQAHWIELVFLIASPIYFLCTTSALTEPLFALVLVYSIYLYLRNRLILCLLVLSLLPFVRNEGYFMWLPFCLLIANKENWWKFIFLGFGTVFFALITGITHNDLLYVIHSNHYLNHDGHYGSGNWLHFFKRIPVWLGIPLAIVFVSTPFILKKIRPLDKLARSFIFLTFSTFAIYFVIHVIFWTFGIMGSLGLERVFGGITSILAVGLYYIFSIAIPKFKRQMSLIFFFLTIVNISLVAYFLNPFIADKPAIMRGKAADFLIDKHLLDDRKIHIFDPQTIVYLNLDNYNQQKCSEIKFSLKPHIFHSGDIIFWDTYCDSEAGLPKSTFNKDEYIELFHTVDSKILTYKKQIYEICIFQKK